MAFFVKSFDFFSGRIHSGNTSPGHECKNGRQIFGEVGLLNTTVWTWNNLWIIREKTESLVGMNYQLLAIVTLKQKKNIDYWIFSKASCKAAFWSTGQSKWIPSCLAVHFDWLNSERMESRCSRKSCPGLKLMFWGWHF